MPDTHNSSSLAPCVHEHTDIRALKCSNGTIQYVKQCLFCGQKVGSAISRDAAFRARGPLEFIAPFDEQARDEGQRVLERKRREAWERDNQARLTAQAEQRSEWLKRHAEYLQTDAWRAKRAKVLKRAGGVCEGCLEAPATEVHHLTYQHWRAELLFELVALCKDCHQAAHRERQA